MRRFIIAALIAVLAVAGLVVNAPRAAAVPGWTTLHRWPGGSLLLACQYTETGGYGPVWHTRLVLAHQPGEPLVHLRASFTVLRITPGGAYRPIGTTHLATDNVGQWDVKEAFGSQIGAQYQGQWRADRWAVGWGDETGGAGDNGPYRFTTLGHC